MSTISSTVPSGQSPKSIWQAETPYAIPPLAASVAILPAYGDLIAKSAQQKGEPVPSMTLKAVMKEGVKAVPTVGTLVGAQMIIQSFVERKLVGESKAPTLSVKFLSSAIVGTVSSPFVAIFNGQNMGWTARQSLGKFSPRQAAAITIQETAFVGGLSVADKLSEVMRAKFGDNKAVDYTAAFIAGAAGSLAGHPANTALTRWQSGMQVEGLSQLMWGSARKARAIGIFSVFYKLGKEVLGSK